MNGEHTGPAIEITALTRRYGAHTAVDQLTFSIPRGSILGLIGPNGAGKSTTIKMLMGILPPTSGRIHVLGLDVASEPTQVRERVGYVPEVHQIYRWMRVGEVIAFTKRFYPTWDEGLCGRALEMFELDLSKRVRHLSKGMQAKLALLLAIAHEPELLILDEPMSGMDPLAREEFLDGVVRVLYERRRTVLFSSHTLDDVQRLADTVGILCDGRLLAHCPVDDLLVSTKRIHAVLRDGCLPKCQPEGMIWQDVRNREWSFTVCGFTPELAQQIRAEEAVESVSIRDLNLEEVFKDYIKGRRPRP